MPTLLRTKRSKRCATCKHILVKPEYKPTSTRHRIKLLALNYIPSISLRPLPVSGGLRPPGVDGEQYIVEAGKATQWILTLRNPLFESVKVSLGTPGVTPGRYGHKVTILCPEFEVGASSDVWDDALNPSSTSTSSTTKTAGKNEGGTGEQIAGKVYEQGRNWVSVVIEIVPVRIGREEGREMEEDEDVIEIPVRVRVEWRVGEEEVEGKKKTSERVLEDGEEDDGRREVSYWMVLGVAKVAM